MRQALHGGAAQVDGDVTLRAAERNHARHRLPCRVAASGRDRSRRASLPGLVPASAPPGASTRRLRPMRRRTSAVAMAARPSPRPVRPSPSVVVADTDTGAPSRLGQHRLRLGAARADPRPVADDLHGGVADPVAVRATTGRATWRSMSAPLTPSQRGSSTPNTAPMSPSPAADSSASHSACAADVAVGMPGAAVGVGEQQTQQPARPPGFDRVHVGAQSDPRQLVHRRTIASASSRSSWVVILNASGSPSTTWTWPPMCSTSDASSVKLGRPGPRGRPAQQLGGESLRSLHGPQPGALRRAQHHPVGVHGLDGVMQRQRGHHGAVTGPQRFHTRTISPGGVRPARRRAPARTRASASATAPAPARRIRCGSARPPRRWPSGPRISFRPRRCGRREPPPPR